MRDEKSVRVILSASTTGFIAEIRRANAAATELTTALGKASKTEQWKTVSTDLGKVGLALTAVAALAVKSWADFDAQMSKVSATGADAKNSLAALRAEALAQGAATKFSATEAAAGEEALLRASVSAENVLKGGLAGALSLAAAGNMSVADSADLAATALNEFHLSGTAAGHVADLLAAGAGKAQGEVSDLAMALKQSALVANQAGLSIEETTGTLAAFASAGLIGSDAGTSFRTMLTRLMNPSKEAAALMSEYGIAVYDASGQFTTMAGLAGQLQSKLGNLTQEQRNAALATIFGNDAIRGANVLYTQGAAGVEKWTVAVDDAGYASQVAKEKMNNLKGDLETLFGSVDTLMSTGGASTGGVLRSIAQSLTDIVNAAASNPEAAQAIVTLVAALGGLALVAAGVMKTVTAVSEFRASMSTLATDAPKAAAGITRVGDAAAKAALGIALASAAAQVLSNNTEMASVNDAQVALVSLASSADKVTVSVGETTNAVSGSATSYSQAAQSATRLASAATSASSSMDRIFQDRTGAGGSTDLVNGVNSLGTALERVNQQSTADVASGVLRNVIGAKTEIQLVVSQFDKLDQAMSKVDPETARKAFAKIAEAADAQGMSVEKLTALFPEYRNRLESTATSLGVTTLSAQDYADWMGGKVPAAIENAIAKSKEGTGASDGLKDALSNQALAAQKAAEQQQELADQIKGAADAALKASGSAIGYQKSIDDAAESLAKNGRTLDINTEAGRNNRAALDDMAASARKLAEANAANGSGLEAVNKNLTDGRAEFIKTAVAMGMNRAVAEDLANQYGLIPGSVPTSVTAPGLIEARDNAARLAAMLNGLPPTSQTIITMIAKNEGIEAATRAYEYLKDKTVTITTLNKTAQLVNGKYAPTIALAGGGSVYGPGTTTSDSILARLSNKEYVVNAESAELPGARSLLDELNYNKKLPGFAGGGQVSLTPPAYNSSTSVNVGSPNVTALVMLDGEVIDSRARVVIGQEQAKIARQKGRSGR